MHRQHRQSRRSFLRNAVATGAWLGVADLGFLAKLPRVSAAEAKLPASVVRFDPSIEPLVRLLEETPQDKLLEEVGAQIQRGLTYRELLAALLLAGVRNIQPRPVGFKFHAVLVINSAHLASLAAPDTERWLPIFWALNQFKTAQAQDVKEGDWTMAAVDESKVPPADKARLAFVEAMNKWDEAGADAATVGLARSASANELFELFCRYGARDFREIGHKNIYVANSWRTLQVIGWQHAEPVLRSLAYALLDRRGDDPLAGDLPADRPGRRNLDRLHDIRSDWRQGKPSREATLDMLAALRQGSAADASFAVVEQLNRGVAAQSIYDALFDGAGELLMRQPGLISLHAVTATNALHYAFQNTTNDETRRFLLLQNAAFLPLFRGDPAKKKLRIEDFAPVPLNADGAKALDEIFADISHDRLAAAGKMLTYLKDNPQPEAFMNAARLLVFFKGRDAHDYKFSSAVLEDFYHISPGWRDRYLAASVFSLRGSGDTDSDLVKRTRAALKT